MYQKVTNILISIKKFLFMMPKDVRIGLLLSFSIEFALGLFDSESDHIINHPSHDSLNVGKPERRRKISKVSDRSWIGDETTALHADEETVKRKASVRSVNDKHELMPINEIARKPSLKMQYDDSLEPSRHEKPLTEKGQKPSDTKLNISKSFQSTRASNSSFLRSTGTRKREVRRGFWEIIVMVVMVSKGSRRF